MDTALAAGVRRLALFHHDPLRDDDAMDALLAACRQRAAAAGGRLEVLAAAEGREIEVAGAAPRSPRPATADALATAGIPCAPQDHAVVLAVRDADTAVRLAEALRAEGLRPFTARDASEAVRLTRAERPALVLCDRDLPDGTGVDVCRTLRAETGSPVRDVPLILVADSEDPSEEAAGVTDWLVRPFSTEYARTKVRAWLLRTRARWTRAPLPANEPARLEALRRLEVLDTPPEERFDRLTRLAQRLFEVPIALVSLVDRDRQWFKSRQGLEARETPREAAFCAHVILDAQPLVVPDALDDPRFADNPLVTGKPNVRFYAGCPIAAPDGSRIGTLCIIDHRPRDLDDADLAALQDLARMVEEELGSPGS